ncbi:sigma-70 family RNA polymerase sigma factor [Catenovulum sp. SM1970]|uniref:sigma-70 family RNA polymerase sigma factor n=1 Tax=Marinifaba aquimaris TaxID=2741323 RepID=UPI00157183C1|nr:sigma-70 family RNA polymerase sigma factor [Marinifaba aquimaris]NTS77760.1 sigma-70 family RNA polymerase sigma factor [Marinifaba aquimaris]
MILTLLKGWFTEDKTPEQIMLEYSQTAKVELLEVLISQYSDPLYRFLVCQCDAELAADVSQLTWIKVIEKRHLYRQQGQFKYWLFKMARCLLIDELRKQKDHIEFDDAKNSVVQKNCPQEKSRQLGLFIAQLPFLQKEALCLQQAGFSISEISEICQTNGETIKTRLRYARAQLKESWVNENE